MITCTQCGAQFPRTINKLSGLPRKNQRDVCSDACWHARLRAQNGDALNARRRDIHKPAPRSSRAKRYHCCMYCGLESMKVLDKGDPNKFCSVDCAFESGRKVRSEIDALRRIGDNYNRLRDDAASRALSADMRAIRYYDYCTMIADAALKRKATTCDGCGCAIQWQQMGRLRKYCSTECFIKVAKQSGRWRVQNRAAKHKRRADKLKRSVRWMRELTDLVWREASHLVSLRRDVCGGDWHADHMIPMRAQRCSGLHVWNNCQVIPAPLNVNKSNRLILTEPGEWIRCL